MSIDLGTVSAKALFDASAFTRGVETVIQQLNRLKQETGSWTTSLNAGTEAVKRQNGSIQQWKAEQTQVAAQVAATTTQVKAQTQAVASSSQTMMQQTRIASGLRAASAEMALAGAALTATLVTTIKTGSDFNRTLQAIQANTGITDRELGALRKNVETLGVTYGGSLEKIALGQMHAINLFHDMAAAEAITVAGAKAAIATHGDEEQVINGLAKSMKEWAIPSSRAAQTMNLLIFAANRANTTLPEMMNHTDRLRATFANLNLPLSEMLAMYATLTQHGLSAAQAETQMINVTQKIIKPTKDSAEAIDFLSRTVDPGLKKAFTLQGIQGPDGFAKLFVRLAEDAQKVKGPVAELVEKVFPNLRGVLAGLVFSGTGMKDLLTNIRLFADAGNRQTELNRALGKSQEQLDVSLKKLHDQFIITSATIAKDMTPGLTDLMKAVSGLFSSLQKLSPETRHFLEWGAVAAAATLLVGSRVLGLAATFYQLRTAIMAAQGAGVLAAGTGGVLGLLGRGALGLGVGAALRGAADVALPAALLIGSEQGTGSGVNDLGRQGSTRDQLRALRFAHQQLLKNGAAAGVDYESTRQAQNIDMARLEAQLAAEMQTPQGMLQRIQELRKLLASGINLPGMTRGAMQSEAALLDKQFKAAPATPFNPLGAGSGVRDAAGKSFGDTMEAWKKQQKEDAKAAKAALAEAKRDAKQTERDAEATAEAIRQAQDKLFSLTHTPSQIERHDIAQRINEMSAAGVPRATRLAVQAAEFKKLREEEARHYSEIKAEGMKNAFDAVVEENQRKTEALERSLDLEEKSLDRLEKLHRRLYDDIQEEFKVPYLSQDELDKKFDLAASARVRAQYKLGDIASEKGMPSELKTDILGGHSVLGPAAETGEMLRKLSKAKFPPTQEQIEESKRQWRQYTRDLKGIFVTLFEDLSTPGRNFFKDILDSFKHMLIQMAAELAASAVIGGIRDLFGLGAGGKDRKGSKPQSVVGSLGGAAIGAIGSLIGGALGFDRGGWVPGPVGRPQLAVVHGGEHVATARDMQHGGGISINGPIHVYGVTDVASLYRELGREARRMAPVRPGS